MKPKEKVEDGIFGTSGGIGFTKQNELFVGRVAMIGFAVSSSSTIILFEFFQFKHIELEMYGSMFMIMKFRVFFFFFL